MEALKCPQCGAPAQAAPGQWQTTCVYCKATISLGAPPAPAYAPPPPQSIPQIVVIGPGMRRRPQGSSAGLLTALPGLVIAVVVAGIVWSSTRNISGFGARDWDGSTPLSCGGNDRVDADGVKASFSSSTVIVASGNCHVTCKACALRGAVGVNASGNAHVTLTGGSLDANSLSVDASGNAHVELLGTRVTGSVKKTQNASVVQ
jgi:hypothetical protein